MFYGFLLTVVSLLLLVIWGLLQIRRIDRIIEQVDRQLGPPEDPKD